MQSIAQNTKNQKFLTGVVKLIQVFIDLKQKNH